METIQQINPVLSGRIKANDGFLTMRQVKEIIKIDPHMQVLVRCGNGRFTTSVMNVEHFVNIINAEGRDYVRDVSLISRDAI